MVKSLRRLAWLATAAAYVQIVLGQVVRITGSGLGCGEHWPLCNGHLIPSLGDLPTLIEWTHRLSALVLGLSVVALVTLAWLRRATPGVGGKGGVLRAATLGIGLYIGIALLGAVTVFVDLSAWAVLPHLAAALGLIATLMVTAFRAGPTRNDGDVPRSTRGGAVGALALGALVVLLGGLTANLGAAGACTGFPLCNGGVWPSGGPAWLQWTHRLMAYALFLHLFGLVMAARRRNPPVDVRRAAVWALGAASAQVVVAAVMVLGHLPAEWRALHAAVGVAVWVALVALAWRATRTASPARQA